MNNCQYCGVDVLATSWATSVKDHERNCAPIEFRRLKKERDLFYETLRQLKAIDTKTCVLVTQTLHKVRDETDS